MAVHTDHPKLNPHDHFRLPPGRVDRQPLRGHFFDQAQGQAEFALSVLVLVRGQQDLGNPPPWAVCAYPLACVAMAAPLGWLARNRAFYYATGGCSAAWLVAMGVQAYQALRGRLAGLDQLAWGLAFFLVAMLISLWKAGLPQRWLKRVR